MTRPMRFCTVVLTQAVFLCVPSIARADAATDWNAIAIQIIVNAPCPTAPCANPPVHPGATSFLDSAMVQAAVYDAVESITGRFRPYAVHVPGASGSADAAVAKAAHDVLVNRFPFPAITGFLDTTYHAYLAAHSLSESDPGVAVGAQAAAGIIALRANDGSFPSPPPPPFTGGNAPGEWRPTPSYLPGTPASNSPMLAPWLAMVTPFTLKSPSQFRPVGPPDLTSHRYTEAYDEIKTLGSFSSTVRTTDQTNKALFYSGNYLVVWNRAVRDITTAHLTSIDDSVRLLALVNLAMGDGAISQWDTKRHFVFWRPVTAIQNGDNDGNPYTVGDPNWQPLINNPNYPEYASGANTVTGAATRMLALFFGSDDLDFTMHTTVATAPVQAYDYHRFSDVANDVVNARVWEGIHFRFSDLVGRRQGRRVSHWVFTHYLRSVEEDASDDYGDDAEDE
jgi:hypothetical protein